MFSYIREELLLEKYIEVKKSIRADPTQGRAVVDRLRHHILTAADRALRRLFQNVIRHAGIGSGNANL